MKKINLFKSAQISVEMLVVIGIFIIGAILVGVLIINNLNNTQENTTKASNIDPLIKNFKEDTEVALGNSFTVSILKPSEDQQFSLDENIYFEADIDNNSNIVTCKWDSNISNNFGLSCVMNYNQLHVGNHEITLIATELDGQSKSAKVNIKVT
jgi:hypothetical protein